MSFEKGDFPGKGGVKSLESGDFDLESIELHAHLYGCLEPQDIWEWGKDIWKFRLDRLHWFQKEYQKLTGKTPSYEQYWTHKDGLSLLTEDFTMLVPGPFSRFQSGFNLAIALFPLDPYNTSFLSKILANEARKNFRYGEYRIVVPAHFTQVEIAVFCRNLIDIVSDPSLSTRKTLSVSSTQESFVPKFVLSLNRKPELFQIQYDTIIKVIQDVLSSLPASKRGKTTIFDLGISGIDLCGVEEGNPPKNIKSEISRVRKINSDHPQLRLDILYHVGESFQDKSLFSAIRWVHEASLLGVDRLGHALCLGVHPARYFEADNPGEWHLQESVEERYDTIKWLLQFGPQLKNYGFPFSRSTTLREMRRIETTSSHSIGQVLTLPEASWPKKELIEYTLLLQKAVTALVAEKNQPIEVCPTSNRIIGQIDDLTHHPLRGFLRYLCSDERLPQFPLVIGADDPGIFKSTLFEEWDFVTREFKEIEKIRPRMQTWYCDYLEHRHVRSVDVESFDKK